MYDVVTLPEDADGLNGQRQKFNVGVSVGTPYGTGTVNKYRLQVPRTRQRPRLMHTMSLTLRQCTLTPSQDGLYEVALVGWELATKKPARAYLNQQCMTLNKGSVGGLGPTGGGDMKAEVELLAPSLHPTKPVLCTCTCLLHLPACFAHLLTILCPPLGRQPCCSLEQQALQDHPSLQECQRAPVLST